MSKLRWKAVGPSFAVIAFVVAVPASAETSGAYVGLSVGYGWTDAKARTSTVFGAPNYLLDTSVPAVNETGRQSVRPNGFIGGFDVGYDVRSGNMLYGVAADVSVFNSSDSASDTTVYPCCAPFSFTIRQSVKTKWMTTVRARLGYDVGGATLYVTGGYAGLKARYSARFTDDFASALEQGSKSQYRSGWVVGAGAELEIGPQFSVQPEFLHADFGHLKAPASTFTSDGIDPWPDVFTHRARVKTNIARVGLHYRF